MISPDLLQAAVVARLRGDANVIAAVPESADGVREAEWHGTAFQYPNVRVHRPALEARPYGGRCINRVATAGLVVSVHSKRDTSRIAQQLLGIVETALRDTVLETVALRTTNLMPVSLEPVAPNPQNELVWSGRATFRTVVTEL